MSIVLKAPNRKIRERTRIRITTCFKSNEKAMSLVSIKNLLGTDYESIKMVAKELLDSGNIEEIETTFGVVYRWIRNNEKKKPIKST